MEKPKGGREAYIKRYAIAFRKFKAEVKKVKFEPLDVSVTVGCVAGDLTLRARAKNGRIYEESDSETCSTASPWDCPSCPLSHSRGLV